MNCLVYREDVVPWSYLGGWLGGVVLLFIGLVGWAVSHLIGSLVGWLVGFFVFLVSSLVWLVGWSVT